MRFKFWLQNTNLDFIKIKRFNYALSITISVISILLLIIKGLNFGIDFVGGINIEIRTNADIAVVRHQLQQLNLGEVSIQHTDTQDLLIKIGNKHHENAASVVESVKQALTQIDQVEYRQINFVGPQVGQYLIYAGTKALVFSFIAITLYIWFRFEWQFGIGILIALVHDAILALGFASLMQLDFSLSSIAALLTIIGYSVNDSVVIYDRVRANLRQYRQKSIEDIINLSINQTLSRTTLTVASTLLANLALILFGGGEIRSFSILVFFGIIAGTYSSIFISAPILTMLKLDKFK